MGSMANSTADDLSNHYVIGEQVALLGSVTKVGYITY